MNSSLVKQTDRADSERPVARRVLERGNLQRALKQVCQNQGAPGIDGMTVDELPDHLRHHWPEIRAQLETGRYWPLPVKRVEIPKADGKTARWAFRRCWTASSSKPSRKSLRAMGTALPPQELWISPAALGPSGRAAKAGGPPRRLPLGGGPGSGSLFRPSQPRPADEQAQTAVPDGALLSLINRYLKAGVGEGDPSRHAEEGTARRTALAGVGQRGAG